MFLWCNTNTLLYLKPFTYCLLLPEFSICFLTLKEIQFKHRPTCLFRAEGCQYMVKFLSSRLQPEPALYCYQVDFGQDDTVPIFKMLLKKSKDIFQLNNKLEWIQTTIYWLKSSNAIIKPRNIMSEIAKFSCGISKSYQYYSRWFHLINNIKKLTIRNYSSDCCKVEL